MHSTARQTRFGTWRQLWLTLAIAEKELGLPIPDGAIEEMQQHLVRPTYPLSQRIPHTLVVMLGTGRGSIRGSGAGGEETSTRCNGSRSRLWSSLSHRRSHHSSRCHFLLRHRQCRPHLPSTRLRYSPTEIGRRYRSLGQVCRGVQELANVGMDSLPAGSIDDGWKTMYSLDSSSYSSSMFLLRRRSSMNVRIGTLDGSAKHPASSR